jgi:hypothetical protein
MDSSKLRRQSSGILAGYMLQFVAGMLLNLFVTIPSTHPGSSGKDYFTRSWHSLVWTLSSHGGWQLAFHVYLALFLVLGSISLFVRAYLQHDKNWSIAGGVAALFTIGAFFNGLSFIDFNKNISSMIMAVCWLAAVSALIFGLVRFPSEPVSKRLSEQRTNARIKTYNK